MTTDVRDREALAKALWAADCLAAGVVEPVTVEAPPSHYDRMADALLASGAIQTASEFTAGLAADLSTKAADAWGGNNAWFAAVAAQWIEGTTAALSTSVIPHNGLAGVPCVEHGTDCDGSTSDCEPTSVIPPGKGEAL